MVTERFSYCLISGFLVLALFSGDVWSARDDSISNDLTQTATTRSATRRLPTPELRRGSTSSQVSLPPKAMKSSTLVEALVSPRPAISDRLAKLDLNAGSTSEAMKSSTLAEALVSPRPAISDRRAKLELREPSSRTDPDRLMLSNQLTLEGSSSSRPDPHTSMTNIHPAREELFPSQSEASEAKQRSMLFPHGSESTDSLQSSSSGTLAVPAVKSGTKVTAKVEEEQESAGLSKAEKDELEQLKQKIRERKAVLKGQGISAGNCNREKQVVEWVNRMIELKIKEDPSLAETMKATKISKKDKKDGKTKVGTHGEPQLLSRSLDSSHPRPATELRSSKDHMRLEGSLPQELTTPHENTNPVILAEPSKAQLAKQEQIRKYLEAYWLQCVKTKSAFELARGEFWGTSTQHHSVYDRSYRSYSDDLDWQKQNKPTEYTVTASLHPYGQKYINCARVIVKLAASPIKDGAVLLQDAFDKCAETESHVNQFLQDFKEWREALPIVQAEAELQRVKAGVEGLSRQDSELRSLAKAANADSFERNKSALQNALALSDTVQKDFEIMDQLYASLPADDASIEQLANDIFKQCVKAGGVGLWLTYSAFSWSMNSDYGDSEGAYRVVIGMTFSIALLVGFFTTTLAAHITGGSIIAAVAAVGFGVTMAGIGWMALVAVGATLAAWGLFELGKYLIKMCESLNKDPGIRSEQMIQATGAVRSKVKICRDKMEQASTLLHKFDKLDGIWLLNHGERECAKLVATAMMAQYTEAHGRVIPNPTEKFAEILRLLVDM